MLLGRIRNATDSMNRPVSKNATNNENSMRSRPEKPVSGSCVDAPSTSPAGVGSGVAVALALATCPPDVPPLSPPDVTGLSL